LFFPCVIFGVSFLAYLYDHDDSRNTGFLAKDKLEKFGQTLYSKLAELARQFAVIEKEFSQDFGDSDCP
jgi:hypothetical protein